MEKSSSGQVKWTLDSSNEVEKKDAGPKYSRISESLRHVAPTAIQCSMFCGGRQCKYENPAKIKDEEMAIKGLYSSWVTSDILATARPSTEIIKKYDVIAQFHQTGINSLMNLQHAGEHASCGYGLEDSGFSYVPEDFMQQDIFFYNFGWNDYGVRSLESILDMVKVMSFALKEGKAAVHCHAGLGRTGVLIACYLVFSERIEAEEAIHRVRASRPKAVQTRGQIACVNDFTNFLTHLWIVFSSSAPGAKKFSLQHYLTRQRHLLHGMESRLLKYIPKVVYLLCCRLLEVAGVKGEDTPLTWTLSNEVKAVFAEVDESEVRKESARESVEDLAHALRHSPYVDPSLPSSHTALLQLSQSVDVPEEDDARQELARSFLGQLGSKLSQPTETIARDRRASDSFITRDRPLWENQSIPASIHSARLEPLNLSTEKKEKKKKEKKMKKLRSQASSDATASGTGTEERFSGFLSAAKQNIGQSVVEERVRVAKALASSACTDSGVHNRTDRLKRKLNSSDSGWEEIRTESDPWVLTRLLWSWLEDLAEPVLKEAEVTLLEESITDPVGAVKKLKRGERDTVECLITIICELEPLRKELADRVLRRTAVVLTHNKELPLTLSRATLDRSPEQPGTEAGRYSPQSPTSRGNSEEREEEFPVVSESLIRSPSYRLLVFLRQLVKVLKGTGGLEANSRT